MDGEDPEELDEERRLAYVAITRARRSLAISHAGMRFLFGRTKYLSPSRFLSDLPSGCFELSGESRPRLPGFGGGEASALAASPAWRRRSGGEDWGATRGRRFGVTPSEPQVSPGGRAAAKEIQVARRIQPKEQDAVDEIPPDEFSDPVYDDQEAVVVRPGQRVRHKKFGRGVVERVESGAKPTVVARFAGYGPKRIVAEYLEFES
jgi:DNA helicase-2/ATP-dependent DNA helicase PcrA